MYGSHLVHNIYLQLAQICPAFNWSCHLSTDASDASSVLHSVFESNSSALLLHVLLLSDNLRTCTGLLFYCVFDHITLFEALYH